MTWVFWALAATVFWGVWGVFSAIATRAGTALGVLAGALVAEAVLTIPFWGQMKSSWTWAVGATGIASGLAYLCFFVAIKQENAPAAAVVALTALYPLVTGFLSWIVLGETLSVRQWMGVALAVVATILIACE